MKTKKDRIPYTYVITNNITGIRYYGARWRKGCNPSDLWTSYFTSSQLIHSLIESQGVESWTIEVRKIFDTVDQCIEWEQRVLCRLNIPYNTAWYNQSRAGQTFVLKGAAKERHARIVSENQKKRWQDPEYSDKMANVSKARWDVEGSRKAHGDKIKLCWEDDLWREQIIQDRKEKAKDPARLEKRKQAALDNWQREEYRRNHEAAMKVVRADPEWIEGNRKRMKERWDDPVERAKMLENRPPVTQEIRESRSKHATEANKITWADPEIRARRIATLKATLKRKREEKLASLPNKQSTTTVTS